MKYLDFIGNWTGRIMLAVILWLAMVLFIPALVVKELVAAVVHYLLEWMDELTCMYKVKQSEKDNGSKE